MQYTIGHRVGISRSSKQVLRIRYSSKSLNKSTLKSTYSPPSSLNLHSHQHADFIGPFSPYSCGGAGPSSCVSVAESRRFGIVRAVRDEVALRVSRSSFQLLRVGDGMGRTGAARKK